MADVPAIAQAVADYSKLGIGIGVGGAVIGIGMIVAGAAKGIGNIGGNAVEAIARQPEAGGRIGTNMIIAAALIEGFTFFALIVAFLALGHL
ncbi:MAG: ATP synthase F0 subunit C [Phycisphaerae bacterium]